MTALRTSWRGDLAAGLTVGIVALPLALAFGASAGVGPAAGLATAVVAGILAAVFGGSNVQVSGPTGAMVVVLAPIVGQHGPAAVAMVALLGGLMVIAAGLLRFGRIINMVPWPVIEGFTLGIAVIIALQQVPALVGQQADPRLRTPAAAWQAVMETGWTAAGSALLIAGVVAVTMLGGQRWRPRLPWSLIGIVLATALAETAGLEVARIGALPDHLPMPGLPELDLGMIRTLLGPAVAVALLAAIESLLSAKVAASLADTGPFDPDRELVGQGIASVGSGFFGGMPATGAIARTAVNVAAGGRTRLAAVIHALVLLVVIYTASGLVGNIPLAALAGVLAVVSLRMVDLEAVRTLVGASRAGTLIFAGTAVITVAFDLIEAIWIGIAATAFFALRSLAVSSGATREELPAEPEHGDERIALFRLDGSAFFAAADKIADAVDAVRDVDVVILRMSQLTMLDATGARRLSELITALERRQITVLVKGLQERHRTLASRVGVLDALRHSSHAFESLDDAIEHARSHVHRA